MPKRSQVVNSVLSPLCLRLLSLRTMLLYLRSRVGFSTVANFSLSPSFLRCFAISGTAG
jgi:hypothetical protein